MAAKKFRHKHIVLRTTPSFIALLLCSQPRRLKYLHTDFKHERFPFPNMQGFIKIPLELDVSKNVEFDNIENAVAAVRTAVKKCRLVE